MNVECGALHIAQNGARIQFWPGADGLTMIVSQGCEYGSAVLTDEDVEALVCYLTGNQHHSRKEQP